MSSTHLELLHHHAAHKLLHDAEFLTRWQKLHNNCPHATAFQEPEFACAWYEEYQDQWQPLLVYSQDSNDDLIGLFLLAYNPATQTLSHAGDEQAEYHAWLALPNQDVAFLSAAWNELTQHVNFATLRFRFLPTGALGDTLKTVPSMRSVAVRKRNRPLIHLDADDIKSSFAKKSNKSRFNRLKKLGTLEFRRITDATELERVFDELIAFYDLRQGAVNHSTPFQHDANKRPFHSKSFAAAPDKVYLTVTYLNERPIAGLWGLISGKTVSNAMIMHSPFLAEHSLGKLHIMQLSDFLLKEGMEAIDLTPGSDPWKDRFANAYDEVAEAIVYRSESARIKGEMIHGLLQWVKRRANQAGITTAELQSTLATVRGVRPSTAIPKIKQWISEDREFRLYRLERPADVSFQRDEKMNCNALADLLSFMPSESGQSLNSFLSDVLTRLERGENVYTLNSDKGLTHYGWMMVNKAETYMSEFKQKITFPPNSITLYDFYTHSDFQSPDRYQATIDHILHEAFSDEKTQYIYISMPADNLPNRQVVETMGFEYQESFFIERRFGVEKIRGKA